MIWKETGLQDAFLLEIEPHRDERGFFARSFCRREFEAHGVAMPVVQSNISYNAHRGTLRGLHYQAPPHEEAKLIRCTRGSVYDVILDLRPGSATRFRWVGVELTARDRNLLYVPPEFAHGFLTLEDETEVFYEMSAFYVPEAGRGIRWDDPRFGIRWPFEPKVISARDRDYPDYVEPQGAP